MRLPKRPFLTIAAVLTLLLLYQEWFVTTQQMVTVRVLSKQVVHLPHTAAYRNGDPDRLNDYDTGDSTYLVRTNAGSFEVSSGEALNRQVAGLLIQRLKPGQMYRLRVVGHSVPWLGIRRKIIAIE